jgi:hypothetical protein
MQLNQPRALENYIMAAFKKSVKAGALSYKSVSLTHPTWSKEQVLDSVTDFALVYYEETAKSSNLPAMFTSIKMMFREKLKLAIRQEVENA